MDEIKDYHDIVYQVMQEYNHRPSHGEIYPEFIVDREKGHYELMLIGWDGARRVHESVLHLDIIDGKVWIQFDGTAPGVALDLLEAGIPKEHIVLAFRPEGVRPHTGFAVN